MSSETIDTEGDNLYRRFQSTLSHHHITRETAQLLSLQLVGSVERKRADDQRIRGEIHLGILFDAETDTAALLHHLEQLSPDSTYVNGSVSSSSGLLADTQDRTLNTGVVFEDGTEYVYFDRAASLDDRTKEGLAEILSQGTLTISMAGVRERCETNASILAVDTLAVDYTHEIHRIDRQLAELLPPATQNRLDMASIESPERDWEVDAHMLQPEIAQQAIRDARETDPEVKPGTADYIESQIGSKLDYDRVTISTETVRRLIEARARLGFANTVRRDHVEDVVDTLQSVYNWMYTDPQSNEAAKEFDADVVETGTPRTRRDRIRNLKQLIQTIAEDTRDGAFIDDICERAKSELGYDREETKEEINKLRYKGDLYEPKEDHFRTT